jgi:hypothetical protein
MLVLLTGAWGLLDPEEEGPDLKDVARHGPLLVAHLTRGAPRSLADYLTWAFAEIRRGESYD